MSPSSVFNPTSGAPGADKASAHLLDRLQAAEAEVERLREALEPFSHAFDLTTHIVPGGDVNRRLNKMRAELSEADFRRTRQALQEPEGR